MDPNLGARASDAGVGASEGVGVGEGVGVNEAVGVHDAVPPGEASAEKGSESSSKPPRT